MSLSCTAWTGILWVHMTPPITTEPIRVRYGETDQMGHVYYANYLLWFEVGRGAWCRDRGFDYADIERMGFMLPCVEAHLKYRGEVKYDQIIHINTWVSEIRRAAIRFDYTVTNPETGVLCTEGYTWHVLMSTARKAVSIPPDIREMLERGTGAGLE
jgi:acyl-CoA thioester hydrolase